MNRLASLLTFAVLSAGLGYGQGISSFKVTPSLSGVAYYVDSVQYRSAAVFLWPKGSKHELQFIPNQDDGSWLDDTKTSKYSFSGWTDNLGLSQGSAAFAQTITADPSVTEYIANFAVTYQVRLVFMDPQTPSPCGEAPGNLIDPKGRPGLVVIGGTCYGGSATFWATGGTSLNAYPYPGFVFDGWTSNLGSTDAFLRTYEIKGPVTLGPRFSPAKRVRFLTSPMGMKVLIDRTETRTPTYTPCITAELQPPFVPGIHFTSQDSLCLGEFDFASDSQHILSATSPQMDSTGNLLVFDSWSIAGGQNTIYTAKNTNQPETITAKFVPGARVSFVTTPTVLKLKVDGRDNWPSYNFVWAIGSKYTVSAPAEQFDAAGRKYVFKGWSNGGAATQDVVVDSSAATNGGLRQLRPTNSSTVP